MSKGTKSKKTKKSEVKEKPTPPPSNVCAAGLHAVSPVKGRCQCGHFQQRYFTQEELNMLQVLFATMRSQALAQQIAGVVNAKN